MHELHVHVSVAPTATLSFAGVNLLFVTDSDVVDEFAGGGIVGPGSVIPFELDDPPPPQAAIAVNRNTETVLMHLPTTELLMTTSALVSKSE
jgi:hypothetical protein